MRSEYLVVGAAGLALVGGLAVAAPNSYWEEVVLRTTIKNERIVSQLNAGAKSLHGTLSKRGIIEENYTEASSFLGLGSLVYIKNQKASVFSQYAVGLMDLAFSKEMGAAGHMYIASSHRKPRMFTALVANENLGKNFGVVCSLDKQGKVSERPELAKQIYTGYQIYLKNAQKQSADDVVKGVNDEEYAVFSCGQGFGFTVISSKRTYGHGLVTGGSPLIYACGTEVTEKKEPTKYLADCYENSDFWGAKYWF